MMWRSNHPTVFGSERVIKPKECSFFCSKQLRPEATMLKRRGLGGGGVNSHSSPNRGGGGTVLHQNHLVGGLRNNGIIFTPVFTHQPHNTVRNRPSIHLKQKFYILGRCQSKNWGILFFWIPFLFYQVRSDMVIQFLISWISYSSFTFCFRS